MTEHLGEAGRVATEGCILRVVSGSRVHGVNVAGTDDRDEMGVAIPPKSYVLGLKTFESWVHRTAARNQRSQPGDLDLTIYSLRKFASLALRGNPSVLVVLFAPDDMVLLSSIPGQALRATAVDTFSSKLGLRSFMGYMESQRKRMTGDAGQKGVKRPELVERYGFDTKYAGHVIRLGFQGVEYGSTGKFTLPMPKEERLRVIDIRRGRVPLEEVVQQAEQLEARMAELLKTGPLPDEPWREGADMLLTRLHEWAWRNPVPYGKETGNGQDG